MSDLEKWLDDGGAKCSYQRILRTGITAAKLEDAPPHVSERQKAVLHATARIQQLEAENKELKEGASKQELVNIIVKLEAENKALRERVNRLAHENMRLLEDAATCPHGFLTGCPTCTTPQADKEQAE